VFVGAFLALGVWALYRSGRSRSTLLLVLYAVSVVMATVAVRHILFFGISWAVFHADHLDAAGKFMLRRFQLGMRMRMLLGIVAGLAAVVLWLAALAAPFGVQVPGETYPARAVALIKEHLPQGRLAIYFDWGQYALWHLGPEVRVSMDGRRETVYDQQIYGYSLNMTFGMGEWDVLLHRGTPDLVLVSQEHAVYNLMGLEPGWQLVYEDPLCGLFAQEGSALAKELKGALPPSIPYDGYAWRFP
jgi:hypothetical protein